MEAHSLAPESTSGAAGAGPGEVVGIGAEYFLALNPLVTIRSRVLTEFLHDWASDLISSHSPVHSASPHIQTAFVASVLVKAP